MATIILRPTADVSLAHSCSSGSSGYALINEATIDNDSTYIYQTITSETQTSAISWFRLTSPPVKKIKIISYVVYHSSMYTGKTNDAATIQARLKISGVDTPASTSNVVHVGYFLHGENYTGFRNKIVDDFDSSDAAIIGILTGGYKEKKKNDDYQIRITQLYVTLDYEPVSDTTATGIYLKQNSAYKEAQAAYKKVNGVWVQQTDIATLKTEMQSGKYKVST